MRRLLIVAWIAGGCAQSNTVVCGAVTCPPGARCSADNKCIPVGCGDGMIAGTEQCDGPQTDVLCSDIGFYGIAPVGCSELCDYDTSSCNGTCGDLRVNGPENCDGIPPAGYSCADFGFDVGALGCSNACTVAFDACGAIGWRNAPGGATNELRAVWLDGAGSGFAVGLGGTILRSVEGVWVAMDSGTTTDLYGVHGFRDTSDANNPRDIVFAVGAGGSILRLDNDTWTPMNVPPGTGDLYAIDVASPSRAFVVGAAGAMLTLNLSGWTSIASSTTADLHAVAVTDLRAIAVGDNGTVVTETGSGWIAAPGIPALADEPGAAGTKVTLNAVAIALDEVFIGGNAGTFLHRDAGGWTLMYAPATPPSPGTIPVLSLFATRTSATSVEAYLGMGGGVLVRWNGSRLLVQESPTTRSILGITGTGPANVVAVTRGGRVVTYTGTDRHIAPHISTFPRILGLHVDNMMAYGVGDGGTVIWHDGFSWIGRRQSLAGSSTLTSVWATGTEMYVGAVLTPIASPTDVGVWYTTNYVSAPFVQISPFGGVNDLAGFTAGTETTVYAVGDKIQKIQKGQTTTATLDRDTVAGEELHGVYTTPDGTWFIVGVRSTGSTKKPVVLRKAPGATTWSYIDVGFDGELDKVWGPSATDLFAVGPVGLIAHFDGTTWRRMYTGTGENFASVHGNSSHDVYAAGPNGTLYHYDGLAWTRMTSGDFDMSRVWATPERMIAIGVTYVDMITRPRLLAEERCQDPWDDDGKDGINCDDPACKSAFYCKRGGSCATLDRITCTTLNEPFTTYTGLARIDDLTCLDHSTPGPEASLRFDAMRTGPVTITISAPADGTEDGLDVDLVVVDAVDGACQLGTCRPGTATDDRTRTLTFDAVAGQTYYVLVDGPVYTANAFEATVSCPAP